MEVYLVPERLNLHQIKDKTAKKLLVFDHEEDLGEFNKRSQRG